MYQLKRSEFTKTLSVIMVLTLIFSYFAPTVSVKAETNQQMLQNQIIQETLEEFGISEDLDYALVEVQDSNTNALSTFSAKEKSYAIRIDEILEGDILKSNFYVPYTEVEDGTLQNTFRASSSLTSGKETKIYSNITLQVTSYATRVKFTDSMVDFHYYYKPYLTEVKWSNSKDSAKITRFTISIDVWADKYNYNNATGKLGSLIKKGVDESKQNSYSNPLQNNTYASPVLYSPTSNYIFDVQPNALYHITGTCKFDYKIASGKTASTDITASVAGSWA